MKIQLDTKKKIIKIEESVSLGELFKFLDKILPKKEWESFKLESHTVINWNSNPIIIEKNPYPWQQPWYSSGGDLGNNNLNQGTYNIDGKVDHCK